MKQCPVCKRAYTDERLSYCLEDGTALDALPNSNSSPHNSAVTQPSPRVNYNPAPTMRVPPVQFVSSPQADNVPSTAKNKVWIISVVIGLLFVIGGGAISTYLILRKGNSVTVSNDNKAVIFAGNSNAEENRKISLSSPTATPPPTASQLVGMWRTNVIENGVAQEITVTFNSSGTSKFVFKTKRGQTGTDSGTWQFSDGTLYERYSDGASGKGSIKFIDADNVDLTIIDNGVPAYRGIVRHYHRIK